MSLSRRTSSKPKPLESNENDLRNPSDPILFSTPRSPLNAIQDPSHISANGSQVDPCALKGSGSTPKSAQIVAARSGSRVSGGNASARERGCSSRALKRVQDAKSLDTVEASSFELNEDPAFWKDRNVQVLIRIRPVSGMESYSQGYKRCLVQESPQTLTWIGPPETRFTFDHVACETISQENLFRVVGLPMVDNCMSGYNSCMFAYGQTGSGKTYTMMGEIYEMDTKSCEDRGMTPRVFEYLFTRIREDEECGSEDQLKYSCKCSFLEIYNEQITDLLEPSSTNLQLREDMKKGVYVENLKEYEVSSVNDVMDLLLQGAANRKMAATNMNNESSRSHSVFTCVIESRWEKDSMAHLRFGRLNLVDLAGSERQKSSGAEGERLKEAANINRSLSTLGLVIMTLVDNANGRNRHVPYRDSRLTFLLQDSLGGNSKTTIIANVSPSVCCASETLSTLKFAQRAKLIQNNAKVNEDASGDVMALQRQIQKLKDQLTILIRHQNVPGSLCNPPLNHEQICCNEMYDNSLSLPGGSPISLSDPCVFNSEIKELETSLIGALRREEVAEAAVRRLEAEIKHMSRLVHQREDDAQRTKTLLRFREEKLRRLELLADDLVSSDGYLMEENFALSEEIQLLRERMDQNPELTQFALENMRLLEQLRLFQNFSQQGERDLLLTEISHLRNQLLKVLEGKFLLVNRGETQADDDITKELDESRRQLDVCLENNAKLTRVVNDLHIQLKQYVGNGQSSDPSVEDLSMDDHRAHETPKESSILTLFEGDPGEGLESIEHTENTSPKGISDAKVLFINLEKELRQAKLAIKEMESRQACLVAEMDQLKQEKRYLELSRSMDLGEHFTKELEHCSRLPEGCRDAANFNHLGSESKTECGDVGGLKFQESLTKMHEQLERAKFIIWQLSTEHQSELACSREMELVQQQVKAETAQTILSLQEELVSLKQEYHSINGSQLSTETFMLLKARNEELSSRQSFLVQENLKLANDVAARDAEISALSYEWEKAIIDLTTFLTDGCRSLEDTSECFESVVESFPLRSACINEHVERAVKVFIEKETIILDLQRGLENAQKKGLEMKSKLNSLRGATLAITEVQLQENDENAKELTHLRELLRKKTCVIQELEYILECKEDHIREVEKTLISAFEVIKKLYNMHFAESLNEGEIKLIIEELLNGKSLEGNDFGELHADMTARMLLGAESKHQSEQLTTTGICQTRVNVDERMDDNRIGCSKTSEIIYQELSHGERYAEDKSENETSLLRKCKAVQETMEEAEHVLKALLTANEGAKHEKDFWKQASEALQTEKTALLEEVRRLETFNISKDEQYENLKFQIHAISREILDLASSLTECFQQLQCITEGELNDVFSNTFSSMKHFLQIIRSLRSWLEDMMSEVMEKSFVTFVQYQCYKGALVEQSMRFDTYSSSCQYTHFNPCLTFSNDDNLIRSMLDGVKAQQALCNEHLSGSSCLVDTSDVSSAIQASQQGVDGPITGGSSRKHESVLSSDQNCSHGTILQLQSENFGLAHDMELLNVMTSELARYTENLLQGLTSAKDISVYVGSDSRELLNTAISTCSGASSSGLCEDVILSSDESPVRTIDVLENENSIQADVFKEVISDVETLANEIQCLKAQFVQLTSSKLAIKERCQPSDSNINIQDSCSRPIYVHDGDMAMLSYLNAKTKGGNQCLHALSNLLKNLQCSIPLLNSGLQYDPNRVCSSLKRSFEVIQSIEVKVQRLLERCSEINQVDGRSNDLSLKRELAEKDKLIEGLLFDIRLLQESTSNTNSIKDEFQEMAIEFRLVCKELATRTAQIDEILAEQEVLEDQLAKSEAALSSSRSEIEDVHKELILLSDENTKLKVLLEDAYVDKSEIEDLLEDKMKIIEGLQQEIISITSSGHRENFPSGEEIMEELRRVSQERDHLQAQIMYLNDRLEMETALADENEAVAVEARQVAEANKIYAEEREEEVKVLERSIEELESTINILERKVDNMKEEVERHQRIRNGLELEIQAIMRRMLTVENAAENLIAEYSNVEGEICQIPRRLDDRILELCDARKHIEDLEMEKSYTEEEIKQYREHISELVLHSEAQSSLYQGKFKELEAMISEAKSDPAISDPACRVANRTERTSARPRRSGSPFRCISSLVQQMNLEKDQELSTARQRVEELEALSASKQKEVCMLNARLAAVESMTHDVIRDLMGVKLDITNYANLIDQEQLQKLLKRAQQQTEETIAKEEEIVSLKMHIDQLIDERESLLEEINQRKADILASEVKVEKLQQRDQLLTAQNEMLKRDKASLKRRIAELDERTKLIRTQNTDDQIKNNEINSERNGREEFSKRLAQSNKLLSHMRTSMKNRGP